MLVPTAGGPDSDLSAAIAQLLQREYGSEATLMHVADDVGCSVIMAEKHAREA